MKLNDITRGTGFEAHGIANANLIHWTAPTTVLYEQIVKRGEDLISHLGAVAVKTGHLTGRAANDKFIVDEPTCHDHITLFVSIKKFKCCPLISLNLKKDRKQSVPDFCLREKTGTSPKHSSDRPGNDSLN